MNNYTNKMNKRYTQASIVLALLTTVMFAATLNINASSGKDIDSTKYQNIESVDEASYDELNAGVARVINGGIDLANKEDLNNSYELANTMSKLDDKTSEFTSNIKTNENTTSDVDYIRVRCTGYCDYGTTKSGAITRKGIAAGREEWLGKKIAVFEINDDESVGEKIGEYEILDTGYGINGSIPKGETIDIWHQTEAECYNFSAKHGDYVYIILSE